MSSSEKVRLDVDGAVARMIMCSPDTGNALTPQTGKELRAAADSIAADDAVRVVVLEAEGKSFCVGGDLGGFRTADDPYTFLRGLADDLHAAQVTLAEIDAPLVVRVHGVAAGAGLSLVCCADLAIGTPSAWFRVAYTAAGLSPDGGSTYWLPRIVGHRRARELMMTNRRVGAEEALASGILSEVVEPDQLDARVSELAGQLAAGPRAAFGAVKRLLSTSYTSTYGDQLDREAESIARLAESATGQEGIDAFLDKRPPQFP